MEDDRLQLYVTKRRKVVLRRPPRGPPTEAQVETRRRFAEAARSARGRTRTDLPPAAEAVRVRLRGARVTTREEEPGWRKVLRAYLRGLGFSDEEAALLVDAFARD